MWQCFLPIIGEAGLVVLDHFFRMLILYMLLTLLRHYGWEKLQCSECFRLQNNPILSGMVIFQNWGAPLIFGATSTLNWTWKSSSLEIDNFGRFLHKKWPESAKYDHGRCSDKGGPLPIPSHIIISTETRVHTAMYILHIKSCGRESIKHLVLNSQGMVKTIGTLDTEFKSQDIRRRAREWDASYNSCYSTRSAINLATGFSQKRS